MAGWRRVQTILIVLALVNMLPATEAESAWGVWIVVAAAGVASRLLTKPDGAPRLPSVVLTLLVLASVGYLLFEMFAPHDAPSVYVLDLAHFMMLLCACKFLELRTPRDVGLVAIIAFLVLVIGGFVSGSIVFAGVIAVDMTLGLWWLITFQQAREVRALAARREAQFGPVPAPSVAAAALVAPGLWRPTCFSAIGVAGTAMVVFVMVPRGVGKNLFGGIERMVPSAVTGFSEEVKLSNTRIVESQEPVMKVRYLRNGQPILDEAFQPYMRAWSLDSFNGEQWTHRLHQARQEKECRDGSYRSPAWIEPADAADGDRLDLVEQQVWLERMETKCLFALQPALAFGSDAPILVKQDRRDYSLQIVAPPRGPVSYKVLTPSRLTPRWVERLERRRRRYESTPPVYNPPPRIAQLARELKARAGGEDGPDWQERVARAICDHLSKGELQYSLTRQRPPRGTDPVEDFLFVQKQGHCEYFASAMALLARVAGLQARFVTGYFAGEFNPVGGFYQFRQKDAHAWVEVFLPGKGWTTFDPSPPSDSRRRGLDTATWAKVRRFVEFLQFEWSTFVVAFDSDLRQELMGRFQTIFAPPEPGEASGRSSMHPVVEFFWGPEVLTLRQRTFHWLVLLLSGALIALLLRVLYILSLMVREYLPSGRRGGAALQRRPAAKFYDRILRLLRAKGHTRPLDLTPLEFSRRLTGACPELVGFDDVTVWYYEAQFGGQPLDPARQQRVAEFLRRLREDASFGAKR